MTEYEETTTDDGYHSRIVYDLDPENPRTEYDNVCVLTQLANDCLPPGDERDQDECILAAWQRGTEYLINGSVLHDMDLVERYARAFLGAVAVQWWDDPRGSSRIFGYLTRERAEAEGIPDPADYLAGEMAAYVAWCEGNVYGYIVEDPNGDTLDSCFGYYGDRELPYIRDQITEAIEAERDRLHTEAIERFKRMVGTSVI